MTGIEGLGTVCIVIARQGLGFEIFGVYESEKLAKKRVEELSYILEDCSIEYVNEVIWGNERQW